MQFTEHLARERPLSEDGVQDRETPLPEEQDNSTRVSSSKEGTRVGSISMKSRRGLNGGPGTSSMNRKPGSTSALVQELQVTLVT
jgi:hypothetical protein